MLRPPPLDPDVARAAQDFRNAYPDDRPLRSLDDIPSARADWPPPDVHDVLLGRRVRHEEHTAPGHAGDPIELTVFWPSVTADLPGAGIYLIHGGGMVAGHRHHVAALAADLVEGFGATVATVEYRLAPEFPDPVPVEDCYGGLRWFADRARVLGFDPGRLVVMGGSAGGGLAAGITLMARDRQGPPLAGQVLVCPMLDDRNDSGSAEQFEDTGWWDRGENHVGWTALLGNRRGTDDVSAYAAPARAKDLSGLPATFVDVGSAEVFRDEDIAYAARIWAAGGDAELHVWAGGTHGFDAAFPDLPLSRAAARARDDWLRRVLARRPAQG